MQVKYEMVRRVRVEGESVSRAAREFGFSRQWFYELASAFETGGVAALVAARPGPHKLNEEVVGFGTSGSPPILLTAFGRSGGGESQRAWGSVHSRSVERPLQRADRLEVERRV